MNQGERYDKKKSVGNFINCIKYYRNCDIGSFCNSIHYIQYQNSRPKCHATFWGIGQSGNVTNTGIYSVVSNKYS